jgi:hypothetical protein
MTDPAHASLNLFDGLMASGMTVNEMWLRQISVGGTAEEIEVEAYVLGLLQPSNHQHDVLAQAINEHFIAQGRDHPVAYSDANADR